MHARVLFLAAAAGVAGTPVAAQQHHHTFVIVHGAWGGGWDWRAVDSLLTLRGHRVLRVTLTGQGERVHLASPDVGLSTHIADVANTILWENLHDVVLVGHSYGGMVITGVVDRIPERIRRAVYVDAFLPDSGESVLAPGDSGGASFVWATVQRGMSVPPWVGDTLAIPRDVPHALRTLTDTLRLVNPAGRLVPGTYVLTVQPAETPDAFQRFADRAAARGWPVDTIQSDHNPQRSAKAQLVALLDRLP
jgi:pimeloyl-ACP methyl ester carboxylesterase